MQDKFKWSTKKLAVVLYPFVLAAVAVNLFMLNLIFSFYGIPVLSPELVILISTIPAVPVSWLASKWVKGMIDKAENS